MTAVYRTGGTENIPFPTYLFKNMEKRNVTTGEQLANNWRTTGEQRFM
jgi:hypothetical protein